MRNKKEKGYHKLLLWKRLKTFIKLVYQLTESLPKTEEFGLITQMRRAIISVISNFVEGYLDRSQKNKLRYLGIARASLMELEAQSEICKILALVLDLRASGWLWVEKRALTVCVKS
ncbi:four helix bundle protein [Patescibacteria group bacterium]|nr:four helix bundle protein [Patescibacteria group bacterium]